jgi:hypothetical protein
MFVHILFKIIFYTNNNPPIKTTPPKGGAPHTLVSYRVAIILFTETLSDGLCMVHGIQNQYNSFAVSGFNFECWNYLISVFQKNADFFTSANSGVKVGRSSCQVGPTHNA